MPFKDFSALAVLTAAEVDTYLMQQAVITCTSTTRPSAPVEGMRIVETDTDREYIYSGTAWVQVGAFGQWTAFTTVLRNSGQAPVSVTTDYSRYLRHGRSVIYVARIIATGASAGAGLIELDLPFDPAGVNNMQIGTFTYVDASLGPNTHFFGAAYVDMSTAPDRVYGIRDNTAGSNGMATQLAVDDIVTCHVTYEAAS